MRLIDADKLRKDILDPQDCYNGFSDTFDKACIIGVIDEQPTIEPEQQWIPCSERMPEPSEEYLVTVRERWLGEEWTYNVDMAWLNSNPEAGYIDAWDTWNDWCEGQEVEIIAWMPLPKPYNDFSEHMNEPEEE